MNTSRKTVPICHIFLNMYVWVITIKIYIYEGHFGGIDVWWRRKTFPLCQFVCPPMCVRTRECVFVCFFSNLLEIQNSPSEIRVSWKSHYGRCSISDTTKYGFSSCQWSQARLAQSCFAYPHFVSFSPRLIETGVCTVTFLVTMTYAEISKNILRTLRIWTSVLMWLKY